MFPENDSQVDAQDNDFKTAVINTPKEHKEDMNKKLKTVKTQRIE